MEKDAPAHNSLPPGSEPTAGETKQDIPEISVIQIQKKGRIPEIIISDEKQGISIQYAKSPSTKEAVARILRWIEDRSNRRFTYTLPEPLASLLIVLHEVHYTEKQPKPIVFENETLKRAYELVIQYIDKVNLHALKTISIKEAEPPVKPVSPLLGLHEELEKAGAYDKLREMRTRKSSEDDDPEKRVRVLESYLTTNKPMGDLMDIAGVNSVDGVSSIVHRNLDKIFSELPPEVQQEYGGSAKEAIKRKASAQLRTPLSKERIKKGVAGKERTYTKPIGRPKGRTDIQPRKARELSDTHKQNLSESLKRHHQERKAQQQMPPHGEQTIVDLTKPSQEN